MPLSQLADALGHNIHEELLVGDLLQGFFEELAGHNAWKHGGKIGAGRMGA
jgi:hypothetical protein